MAKVKADQLQQIEFIKTRFRNGVKYGTIMAQFVKRWHTLSKRTFDRRYKEAESAIQEEQKRIQSEAEKGVIKDIAERKSKILSSIERQEILSEIARGEIKLKKLIVCDKVIEEREVVPDYMDRKNAIAELNKMDGSYAPAKTDITVNKAGLDAAHEVSYE